MSTRRSHAPLIVAIVLLVLPVLYVVSYLAVVDPVQKKFERRFLAHAFGESVRTCDYRIGGEWAATLYWPLEKIDRKVRPARWLDQSTLTVQYIEGLGMVTNQPVYHRTTTSPAKQPPAPSIEATMRMMERIGKSP